MDKSKMKKWHPRMRDERNLMLTTALFWEVRRDRSDDPNHDPIFTLKPHDHVVGGVTFVSLKRIYMSYDHIPEYEYDFAMDVFNSWEHWLKLCKSSIRQEFKAWREELDITLKAEAISAMLKASRTDDAKGVAAAKYIADKGYSGPKRGRPGKEEVARELKNQASVRDDLMADMDRLGISVAK